MVKLGTVENLEDGEYFIPLDGSDKIKRPPSAIGTPNDDYIFMKTDSGYTPLLFTGEFKQTGTQMIEELINYYINRESKRIEKLEKKDEGEFEDLIASLWNEKGYTTFRHTEVTDKNQVKKNSVNAPDGGIDILAQIPKKDEIVAIQVKYNIDSTLSKSKVREYSDVFSDPPQWVTDIIGNKEIDEGYIVTVSKPQSGARELKNQKEYIELLYGKSLVFELMKYNL